MNDGFRATTNSRPRLPRIGPRRRAPGGSGSCSSSAAVSEQSEIPASTRKVVRQVAYCTMKAPMMGASMGATTLIDWMVARMVPRIRPSKQSFTRAVDTETMQPAPRAWRTRNRMSCQMEPAPAQARDAARYRPSPATSTGFRP